jgi:hypothetical protein
MIGINEIIQQSWAMSDQAENNHDKINCLALAKEAYGMKVIYLYSCDRGCMEIYAGEEKGFRTTIITTTTNGTTTTRKRTRTAARTRTRNV